MPKTELYLRMLSATGSVAGDRLTHRATRLDDDQRLAEAAAHIARLPLVVDDRSAMSLAQIRAKVRSQQRKTHVGLVIVDYLGLVKPPPDAPRHDRRVQVDAIAQGLKNLARDLRVPILALAQLNRGIEGRADKMPALSDLRESGGIEAAADVVLLMHRATNEIHGDVTDLTLFFAKNRHGPQALCHLNFEGPYSRATDQPHRLGATA
jgi:replicative DNA helicase